MNRTTDGGRAWKGRLSPRSHNKAGAESQQQAGPATPSTVAGADGAGSANIPESMGSFSALQDEAREAFARADKDGQGQVAQPLLVKKLQADKLFRDRLRESQFS